MKILCKLGIHRPLKNHSYDFLDFNDNTIKVMERNFSELLDLILITDKYKEVIK